MEYQFHNLRTVTANGLFFRLAILAQGSSKLKWLILQQSSSHQQHLESMILRKNKIKIKTSDNSSWDKSNPLQDYNMKGLSEPKHSQTLTIAGSWCMDDCCKAVDLGGSQTWRSLISLPLKIMYSKTSSLGGTGWSVGRSSVPNDLTETKFN